MCWVCIRDRHTLRSMVRICCRMREVVARRDRSSEQAREHATSFSEWQQLAHALSQPKPSSQHISSTQPKPKRSRRSNLTTFTHMNLHLALHSSPHLALHFTSPPHSLRRPAKPAYPPHEHPVGPHTLRMSKQNAGRSILMLQVTRCREELPNEDRGGCGLVRWGDLTLTSCHVPKPPRLVDLLGHSRIISSSQKVFLVRIEDET